MKKVSVISNLIKEIQNPNTAPERLIKIIEDVKNFENQGCKSLVLEEVRIKLINIARNANATPDVLNGVIEVANGIEDNLYKSNVLFEVAHNAKDKDVLNGVIKAAKNFENERCKFLVLSEVASNANATPDVLNGVIEVAKEMEHEVWKSNVLSAVAKNTNSANLNKYLQEFLQQRLFSAYDESVGKSNPLDAMKESLKDLNIQPEHIEKSFNAMKYVSGGKKLTEENKETLKNDSAWIDLIEKICHYLKKFVTLGFGTTQKESRDNFNDAVKSHVEKIEAERATQLNNNRNF